ncbi:MAG: outer-membrane lipoprotein carrier protein LolA [Bacteroidota bacterium]
MSPLLRSLLLTLVVLLGGRSLVHAQNASAVFERLQSTYDAVDVLGATFTQTSTSSYSDAPEVFSGTLLLSGDRYRIETGAQTFVTDGVVTWIYLADQRQVVINDYVEDETAFSLNTFFATYPERYTAGTTELTQLDGEQHYLLTLQPREADAFFRQVRLWMRDRDNLVTRLEVTDVNETVMTFDLGDITLNPPLSADTFQFTPPEDAELIDLRL